MSCQANISPAPKTPGVRDPKALPAVLLQQSRCAPASPLRQSCLWDPPALTEQRKIEQVLGKSTKIWSRCKTWIFLGVLYWGPQWGFTLLAFSSIFILSRDSWSEVDGWSRARIKNWQISTLGQDEELSDCIFLARNYLNSLLPPNSIIPSSIQNKTAFKKAPNNRNWLSKRICSWGTL